MTIIDDFQASIRGYKQYVYDIIGAAMAVHRELSWGLLEPIYNEALSIELTERGISNAIIAMFL